MSEKGSLYLVALAFIAIFIGGLAWIIGYYVYQKFYSAIQPELNLSSQGAQSVTFAGNLWDSLGLIIVIVAIFYLFTQLQRRRLEEE